MKSQCLQAAVEQGSKSASPCMNRRCSHAALGFGALHALTWDKGKEMESTWADEAALSRVAFLVAFINTTLLLAQLRWYV